MKYTGSLGLLCLAISACGQAHHKEAPVSKADSLKIRLYEHKSSAYQNKAPDSAIYFADQGLKLSKRLHYQFGEALMMNRLAHINEQYGNIKLAVKYQKASLLIFHHLHNALATADAAASLGILEGKQGNFKGGTQLINNALAQYQKSKNTAGIIKACTRLGEINELSGNHQQALQYYTRAEQLNQGRPVSDEYFSLINSMGKLHAKLGNHQQAAEYFEKGINQSGADKHIKAHIAFLNNAGKARDKLGDKQQALAYHQRGLEKARANGLHEEEARSLMGIANVLKNKDAEQSILHLKNALDIAHNIGHKQLASEIYHSLSDIYRQQSRYQEALTALEEHHRLLDSLLNANEGHKIAVLQSSYELAESKLRIDALELANRQKTYQRNEFIFTAIGILIVLMILAFYFYKNRRLNKNLAASNLIKDKLFSIIGHDLRNPIGGITQLLAVLQEEDLTEEQQEMVTEMRKQGKVSLDILNALLNWGEAQLKGIHINPSNFNAKTSITKNIVSLKKHTGDKHITITDDTPENLMVYGDINHFEFITRNLLSNAVKFSHPAGIIEIGADLKAGSDQVIFFVKDYGKGISKAQQEQFLKTNLDVSFGTKGEQGTGIGLMLSKEFIKANKGRIWVDSEEGKGTTFYFTFHKQVNAT